MNEDDLEDSLALEKEAEIERLEDGAIATDRNSKSIDKSTKTVSLLYKSIAFAQILGSKSSHAACRTSVMAEEQWRNMNQRWSTGTTIEILIA